MHNNWNDEIDLTDDTAPNIPILNNSIGNLNVRGFTTKSASFSQPQRVNIGAQLQNQLKVRPTIQASTLNQSSTSNVPQPKPGNAINSYIRPQAPRSLDIVKTLTNANVQQRTNEPRPQINKQNLKNQYLQTNTTLPKGIPLTFINQGNWNTGSPIPNVPIDPYIQDYEYNDDAPKFKHNFQNQSHRQTQGTNPQTAAQNLMTLKNAVKRVNPAQNNQANQNKTTNVQQKKINTNVQQNTQTNQKKNTYAQSIMNGANDKKKKTNADGIPSLMDIQTTFPYPPNETFYEDVFDVSFDSPAKPGQDQISNKRTSAFQRLGPVSGSPAHKKSKLKVKINANKDRREVVEEQDPKKIDKSYIPLNLRPEIVLSTNPIVNKYLSMWIWNRNITPLITMKPEDSKSPDTMNQASNKKYDDNTFVMIEVVKPPKNVPQEEVLDCLLDALEGVLFVPTFIERWNGNIRFLVYRNRQAIMGLQNLNLSVMIKGKSYTVQISYLNLRLTDLQFLCPSVLKLMMYNVYDKQDKSFNLEAFSLQKDVRHFIYFPICRKSNQDYLKTLFTDWNTLVSLNLSNNNLKCLDGFDLESLTPNLKILDLSHNQIERISVLAHLNGIKVTDLNLEGNPLCWNYQDCIQYVNVVSLIFPELQELDGVKIHATNGSIFPETKDVHSPYFTESIVDNYLKIFFPLMDYEPKERIHLLDLYHTNAVMTITYDPNLHLSEIHNRFPALFSKTDIISGNKSIVKMYTKWPEMKTDRYTLQCDVLMNDVNTVMFKITGVIKIMDSDENFSLLFTRTVLIQSVNKVEYKVRQEMLYWEQPSESVIEKSFQIESDETFSLSLKLENPPDDYLKKSLVKIFIKISSCNKEESERYLEQKDWNLHDALELFIKHLDVGNSNNVPK